MPPWNGARGSPSRRRQSLHEDAGLLPELPLALPPGPPLPDGPADMRQHACKEPSRASRLASNEAKSRHGCNPLGDESDTWQQPLATASVSTSAGTDAGGRVGWSAAWMASPRLKRPGPVGGHSDG